MRVAIVGCGFVADLYLKTRSLHPELEVAGVMDRDGDRAERFSAFHRLFRYESIEALLGDDSVDIVLNLTNPRSHFEVSKRCLEADKHVYSEKPLAMDIALARELADLAEARGLSLVSAPCSMLSETAQTMAKAIREGVVGRVRVVYAEMDDGMLHLMPYRKWQSDSGIPWPWKDEFEVGCTLEHAGYGLTWLALFFGPATSVTAFSSVLIGDKGTDLPLDVNAPDFSVACIKFASGVVARLTCSIVAPHDHALRIVGDEGILWTPDTWDYRSPVYIRKWMTIRRRTFLNPIRRRYPLVGRSNPRIATKGAARMDFLRGVEELASAVTEQRSCRLSTRFSVHVNELSLAISQAAEQSTTMKLSSTFEPIEPMPWAVS